MDDKPGNWPQALRVRDGDVDPPADVIDDAVKLASRLMAEDRLRSGAQHRCPEVCCSRRLTCESRVHTEAKSLPPPVAD